MAAYHAWFLIVPLSALLASSCSHFTRLFKIEILTWRFGSPHRPPVSSPFACPYLQPMTWTERLENAILECAPRTRTPRTYGGHRYAGLDDAGRRLPGTLLRGLSGTPWPSASSPKSRAVSLADTRRATWHQASTT